MVRDSFTAGRLRCPACGYILHNLPDWHTCPECGFQYDPHAKVYKIYEQGKHIAQLGVLALLGFMASVFYDNICVYYYGPSAQAYWSLAEFLIVFLGILILLSLRPAYRLIRALHRPCRVLLNHEGIRFECPGTTPLDFGWDRFGEAYVNLITSSLILRDRVGRSLLRHRHRSIGNRRMRRKLAQEMNALAEIYRSAQDPRPTEPQPKAR